MKTMGDLPIETYTAYIEQSLLKLKILLNLGFLR
ncbi:hypothetical protein SAMN05428988_2765 [Chitinophaga sp. YR573]|nr:hypothetical protein SAMN05428988_2765 [Chitinophaga sp. YR573]